MRNYGLVLSRQRNLTLWGSERKSLIILRPRLWIGSASVWLALRPERPDALLHLCGSPHMHISSRFPYLRLRTPGFEIVFEVLGTALSGCLFVDMDLSGFGRFIGYLNYIPEMKPISNVAYWISRTTSAKDQENVLPVGQFW